MDTVGLLWKANALGISVRVSTISLNVSERFPVSIFKLNLSNVGSMLSPINSTALNPGGPSSSGVKLLPDMSWAANDVTVIKHVPMRAHKNPSCFRLTASSMERVMVMDTPLSDTSPSVRTYKSSAFS